MIWVHPSNANIDIRHQLSQLTFCLCISNEIPYPDRPYFPYSFLNLSTRLDRSIKCQDGFAYDLFVSSLSPLRSTSESRSVFQSPAKTTRRDVVKNDSTLRKYPPTTLYRCVHKHQWSKTHTFYGTVQNKKPDCWIRKHKSRSTHQSIYSSGPTIKIKWAQVRPLR